MLRSAKRNLREMAFFGLQEFMQESQYIFERVFRLNFRRDMTDEFRESKSADTVISGAQREKLKKVNNLDLQLYVYAKELFLKRLNYLRQNEEVAVDVNNNDGNDNRGDNLDHENTEEESY